jgi:hypothetical protein
MDGLALLDVAIAMIFLYLLLSLISSSANELISAVFQARAKLLEKGIVRLLDSQAVKDRLYDHPLLRNLHGQDEPWLIKLGRKELPSYIPARNFALALMDTVLPGTGARNALTPARNAAQGTGWGLLEALEQQPSPVPEKVRQGLLCLVHAAGADAARARENIEDWYNSSMDRVSGAYKRRTQFAIFCIGLLATIAVNADSIAIAKRLSTNKTLASAVASSAASYVQAQSQKKTKPQDKDVETVEDNTIKNAKSNFSDTLSTLDKLGLPIGWSGLGDANSFPPWPGFSHLSDVWLPWIVLLRNHLAGWILTAFAISFGAPFWFDILNRFMVVRSTVKPQEKSKEEPSKD